jgi:hypothetical protein
MQNKGRKTFECCGFSSLLHTLKNGEMCVSEEIIGWCIAAQQAKFAQKTRKPTFYGEIATKPRKPPWFRGFDGVYGDRVTRQNNVWDSAIRGVGRCAEHFAIGCKVKVLHG